jgi:hypothetical protein
MSDSPITPDLRLEFHRIDQRYSTFRTFIRSLCWAVVGYFGFGTVSQFAGHSTDLNVALSLVISALFKFELLIAIALTGVACAWAAAERVLRHRKVEKLQGRIRELETAVDPDRSTSGLTTKGQTNPIDKRR